MKIKIISVGKKNADDARFLVKDYLNRISRFAKVEDVVLKPGNTLKITKKILEKINSKDVVIALTEDGKMLHSKKFASWISDCMTRSASSLVFIIGPAQGLTCEITKSADLKLSLSPMTLPHRLARLILVEQIYRAFCIIRNIPYQK